MERNNGKTIAIVAALVAVMIALGVWAWSMSNNDDTTDQTMTSETSNQTNNDMNTSESKDIVATAMDTESLSTLVTAVQAAGLVETLQGEGPFTVFAPNNAAFEKLPEGTLDSLLLPENKEQLASLLTYHVVAGEVASSELQNGQTITTVQGNTLTVEMADDMVYLVDATGARASVVTADVKTSNGIVHIIDSVVMPE